jgi:hypothetical protein
MKTFRTLLDFYIQSSMHVSLSVVALAGVTMLEFDYPMQADVLLFLFFGTVVGYNFVKYAGVANLHHLERTPFLKSIRICTAMAIVGLTYQAFQLPIIVLLYSGAFGSLTILYAFPFLKGRNLRSLKGLKIYIIAIVWAGSTVVVPLVAETAIATTHVWIEFFARFLFVIALTLPFEIRDLKYDPAELGTLPELIGVHKTRWLGVALLIAMFLTNLTEPELSRHEIAVGAFISVIAILFLWDAKTEQSKYYASFWVEGIPILWFWLMWLLKAG